MHTVHLHKAQLLTDRAPRLGAGILSVAPWGRSLAGLLWLLAECTTSMSLTAKQTLDIILAFHLFSIKVKIVWEFLPVSRNRC